MIVFPNCKINLGLNILNKRSDGYHNLETIFYPIALKDSLEIIENRQTVKSPTFPFTTSGIPISGKPSSNLCVKAYRLLKQDFPDIPGVKIHLHKIIPSGAGLGGGSADAAFSLKVMNELFGLHLTNDQLIHYAAKLGSDCPFFIINKPCFAQGRGEILEEIQLDLTHFKFVIVNPLIHIDTGRAFLNMIPSKPKKTIKEIIAGPMESWKDELKNDFEKIIFPQHQEIMEIKESLYSHGAIYASMSGSGSTIFGIFPKEQQLQLGFHPSYFVKELHS